MGAAGILGALLVASAGPLTTPKTAVRGGNLKMVRDPIALGATAGDTKPGPVLEGQGPLLAVTAASMGMRQTAAPWRPGELAG